MKNSGIGTKKLASKAQFKPKPGQTDFTYARWAPVINCVLRHKGKLLVVQRSKALNFYPGYWNGISGFLDDQRSLTEKVADELREELCLAKSRIIRIHLGQIFDQEAPKYGKTWIVHPVLVDVSTSAIKLDWEGAGYRWLGLDEIKRLKLLPGFGRVLESLAPLM